MKQKTHDAIAIVGGRGRIGKRLTQLIRLAAGLRDTLEVPHEDALPRESNVGLVLCWAEAAAAVAAHCDRFMPESSMIVLLTAPDNSVFELAGANERIRCVIAWPEGAPTPRLWELAYAIQRLTGENRESVSITAPLQWTGLGASWAPRTTPDLFATLEALRPLLESSCIDQRTARRVQGVAHEMLMNAMYDAPIVDGEKCFAHDRTQQIELEPNDAPTLAIGTDGLTLALQISDPFGGLRRNHVYASLLRGLGSATGGTSGESIDTSGGGAGLGLHRIVCESAATLFDVVESRATRVTSTFDLTQANRDRRRQPRSLLYFQRAS